MIRLQASSRADRRKQLLLTFSRFEPLHQVVEHLGEPHRKQRIGLEAGLPSEQVQLHQQFIHHPPVETGDDMGVGGVKTALAVGNGLRVAQDHALQD